MSFVEARAVLEKLASEAVSEKPKIEEQIMRQYCQQSAPTFRFSMWQPVSQTYLAGRGQKPPTNFIEITFSAPSSGHQVTSVDRTLTYDDPADQPKISEALASLEQRLGMKDDVLVSHGYSKHTYGFANGKRRRTRRQHSSSHGSTARTRRIGGATSP